MQHPLSKAILATLCYGDIFDYPLTKEEIEKYLISENFKFQIANFKLKTELDRLIKLKKISSANGYYCLRGREEIIAIRLEREKWSKEKIKNVRKIAKVLSYIPTVRFVGLSGSVAMHNADKDDDIDIFLITKAQTVWITRLLVLLLLGGMGIRRKRGMAEAPNLFCVNMILDETSLALSKKFQHLFGAHEVVQLYPLLDTDNMYQKFIQANPWIQNFLPNALSSLSLRERVRVREQYNNIAIKQFAYLLIGIFYLLEPFARFFQQCYMKNHATSEIITSSLIAFHPVDYKQLITTEYKRRIKKYGL